MEERGYLLYKNGQKEYFPEGISILSGYKGNNNIVEVMIPDSVLVIGNNAFESCKELRKVCCSTDTSKLIHIGELAFNNCYELQEFQIADSITTVDSYAFSGTKLSIMDFSDSHLKFLGYGAFEMCSNLMKVHLKYVDNIPGKCFNCCTNLMAVAAYSDICRVGDYAFYQCRSLLQIPKLAYDALIGSDNDALKQLR